MSHLHRRRPCDDPPGQLIRFADGVVFQHLVAGPVTISTLAEQREAIGRRWSQNFVKLRDERVEAARLLLVDTIKQLGASPSIRARAVRPPR
ncbi:hypothetical protein E0H73_04180 [Kribbella pittospori]|uniref:Uncharacterized protein n=1 Tax=Kribbella pittospori TaxID=722689 RepID=A0A4R0L2N9_9ACTN|nr:hypothetical protein [Kribbella pittospori]TCC66116.1 hypothetical protein E0H73_04180 [Kribbella pittospori]